MPHDPRPSRSPAIVVLSMVATLATAIPPGCSGPRASGESGLGNGRDPTDSAPAPETIPTHLVSPSRGEADDTRYSALAEEDILGGEVTFAVNGAPKDVLDMILDFDHEAGHRPWRLRTRLIETDGTRFRVEAEYEGKAGLNPSVVLVHEVSAVSGGYLVRFRIEEPAFGLDTFTGEYEMIADGPDSSRLRERVFIDSGLPFINATEEDIREALLRDAQDIRSWMATRLGTSAAGSP